VRQVILVQSLDGASGFLVGDRGFLRCGLLIFVSGEFSPLLLRVLQVFAMCFSTPHAAPPYSGALRFLKISRFSRTAAQFFEGSAQSRRWLFWKTISLVHFLTELHSSLPFF